MYDGVIVVLFIFFFNDTATTEIYTLSLHDALPIWAGEFGMGALAGLEARELEDWGAVEVYAASGEDYVLVVSGGGTGLLDRKSTRLNSSHANISYAVFCLKKKKIPHI